ncbi:growth/differentiation factor 8-like [Cydia pomonella]|uniref:growth/differentiation factor 8-like n=1 Tax=Cydia pomonella TaxID=82600 RepID=UPI002ADDAE56|nr:growth/differentiation factor 8-like [Cydia pomonella]
MRSFVYAVVALCLTVSAAPSEKKVLAEVVERPLAPWNASPPPTPSEPRYEDSLCQRRSFNLSFADLGWDWVIAPPHYDAGFCAGTCQLQRLYPYAFMLLKLKDNKPCCVPTKFESVNMAYYDHDKTIVTGNIPYMKVKTCGCR